MEANKVYLRAVEPEDVDFILECESDRDSARWSDYRAPFSRNQLLTYAFTYDADPFTSGNLRLIIETSEKDRIGIIDLYDISEKDSRAFVGICIHPSFRRKGFGEKALNEIIMFAKDRMGLIQLVAKVSVINSHALSLFRKLNFEKLGVLPCWHRIGTELHDFTLLSKMTDSLS